MLVGLHLSHWVVSLFTLHLVEGLFVLSPSFKFSVSFSLVLLTIPLRMVNTTDSYISSLIRVSLGREWSFLPGCHSRFGYTTQAYGYEHLSTHITLGVYSCYESYSVTLNQCPQEPACLLKERQIIVIPRLEQLPNSN